MRSEALFYLLFLSLTCGAVAIPALVINMVPKALVSSVEICVNYHYMAGEASRCDGIS